MDYIKPVRKEILASMVAGFLELGYPDRQSRSVIQVDVELANIGRFLNEWGWPQRSIKEIFLI